MAPRIQFLGTTAPCCFQFGDGHLSEVLPRHLWFDRDIDGRWVVWSSAAGTSPDDDESDVGSMIVNDPAVTTFLESLAAMVAQPARFQHEPRLEDPSLSPERHHT